MASSFQIPLHFEDLKRSAAENWQVSAQGNVRTEDLLTLATCDIPAILGSDSEPSPNESFTAMYNAINRYGKSNASLRKAIIKAAVKLSSKASAASASHVKITTFFLCGLIAGAEALGARCKAWDKAGKESVLEALLALVSHIVTPSPFPAVDSDKIAGLLQRTALTVLQNASAAKDKTIRALVARLLATALKFDDHQQVGATSAIVHALFRQENIANSIAEVLHILAAECDLVDFSSALVREVASLDTDALAKDAAAAKSFSTLIGAVAELDIEVIKSNLAGLLAHLDGPSYMMRNGVIHAMGILISSNPKADDPLLKVLAERAMKDVNAFTRSKALQTWATLAADKVVPFKLFPKIAAIAASRLDDKGSVVRKSAAQLLGTLLQTNPFGPVLKLSVFQPKLDEEEKFEEERMKIRKEQEAAIAESEDTTDGGNSVVEAGAAADIVENEEEKENVEEDEDTRRLNFYRAAVGFIEAVEDGLSKVYGMLRSKSITDVSEGVNFLVTVIQFQLDAAASGKAVRAMLPLALAREANIRAAAVKAYVTLLNPGGEGVDEKAAAMAVTNGLVSLATGATTGEVACLESLVAALSKSTKECPQVVVTPAVITVTWDLFSGKIPGATIEQRNSAAMLIGMFTATYPESLLQRVQILEDVGLNHEKFALWSCAALCRLPVHCDTSMKISRRVIELCKTTTDLAVVDRAITAIYQLHPNPEADVSALIAHLARNMREARSAVPVDALSRFLLIIGAVAVKQLVRVEALIKSVKRTKILNGDNEDIERASAEADNMLLLAEKELVDKNSLLGRWGGLAARISADENNACDKLRASAVLCMTKLMCLQAEYCERNLQLLFTILERAPQAHVRSNAVTALGDLAYRFPNQVEPWSSRIYAALRDEHRQVRTNTLMALTHLILNDQVKVKGQIVEIAICLLDKEARIADLSRIFFHELARKQKNSIYNILPDTISCLSRKEVNSADFKTVIGFLIALLDKDKHHEGMIDKLCHRFRATKGIQETRDLAYCVAQLNISEKGLKNLNDKFKSYSNHLIDDEVHKFFTGVVAKGRKNCTSQNAVQMMDELELKIENQRKSDGHENASSYAPSTTAGADSEMTSQRGADSDGGSVASTKSNRSAGRGRGRRSTAASTKSTTNKKKQMVISVDLKKTKPIAKRAAKKKPVKKAVSEDSESYGEYSGESEEEEDIEVELGSDTDDTVEVTKPSPKKKKAPPKKKTAVAKKKKASPEPRKQRPSRSSRKKAIVYSDSESEGDSDDSFDLGSDSD